MKLQLSIFNNLFLLMMISMLILPGKATGQDKPSISKEQYLFPEFSECTIMMGANNINKAVGNYNTITEKMAFIKDNVIYGISDIIQADTVTINNRQFIPFNGIFLEVLLNAPVALFVKHKSNIIPPGQPVGYGATSRTSKVDTYSNINTQGGVYGLEIPDGYEIRYLPVYWIRKDGVMNSFINKSQFLNIFPAHKKALKDFMKNNRIRMESPDDLINLTRYCNELN